MDDETSEAGFTMVEMMCAIFIIAIGLLALVGTFANSIREQRSQRLQAQALRIATASVEDARQLPFSSPTGAGLLQAAGSTSSTVTSKGTTYTLAQTVQPCAATDAVSACTTAGLTKDTTAVRVKVDVTWQDGTATRHLKLGTSVTDDSAKLQPAGGASQSWPGGAAGVAVTLGSLSLSPTTVAVSGTGVAQSPVTASISAVGASPSTVFPLTWADDTGSHQASLAWTGGTTWSATIPGSSITRNAARGSVVFAASVPGSNALPSVTLTTVAAPAITGTCTINPAVIALRTLTTVSAGATTLTCTTSGLAASDSVKVAWTTATGTSTATLTSTTGSTWTVVVPAGSPMRLVSVPFTFTPARASDGVSGASQTVTAVAA